MRSVGLIRAQSVDREIRYRSQSGSVGFRTTLRVELLKEFNCRRSVGYGEEFEGPSDYVSTVSYSPELEEMT